MNLTKYKDQILQLQRCIVLVEQAEESLEVVKTLPYYHLYSDVKTHQADILKAEKLLEATQSSLRTQLFIMADSNREDCHDQN